MGSSICLSLVDADCTTFTAFFLLHNLKISKSEGSFSELCLHVDVSKPEDVGFGGSAFPAKSPSPVPPKTPASAQGAARPSSIPTPPESSDRQSHPQISTPPSGIQPQLYFPDQAFRLYATRTTLFIDHLTSSGLRTSVHGLGGDALVKIRLIACCNLTQCQNPLTLGMLHLDRAILSWESILLLKIKIRLCWADDGG